MNFGELLVFKGVLEFYSEFTNKRKSQTDKNINTDGSEFQFGIDYI